MKKIYFVVDGKTCFEFSRDLKNQEKMQKKTCQVKNFEDVHTNGDRGQANKMVSFVVENFLFLYYLSYICKM